MRHALLILIPVFLCAQSAFSQENDENVNQSPSTILAINFNRSGPNRYVSPDNFFTIHCGLGHGIDISLMHIPQKFIGFYGNVFYSEKKYNESPYNQSNSEYSYVLKSSNNPRPSFKTTGLFLGIAGIYDPTKNGALLFNAKAGLGFCNTDYLEFGIIDNQGLSLIHI